MKTGEEPEQVAGGNLGKRIGIPLILLAVILLCVWAGMRFTNRSGFEFWNESSAALAELRDYVHAVTDKSSPDYIPEKDRIAVFDMDGTLYGEKAPIYIDWWLLKYRALEDPLYAAPEDIRATAEKIVLAGQTGKIPEELEMEHAQAAAKAFAGMTLDEYRAYVTAFILKEAEGFEGLTYAGAWYLPMLEVVDYLNENGFTVYICSGTERFLCRILAEGMVDIPEERIIGMDVRLEASGQDGCDGLEYAYTAQDRVVRTDELLVKNVNANKVAQIAQEIGRQPVLSFGNSSGDQSMAMYVTSGNPYRSAVFMLVADDEEREYGNRERAAAMREKWEDFGWNVISMRDDFLTIYGDDVTRKP